MISQVEKNEPYLSLGMAETQLAVAFFFKNGKVLEI
jgi:hypothetical protein